MNSSAKTTAISLLAAAALGAAVFTGCTVTSGTVDDIDGGTQPNKEKDAGATDNDAGETKPDASAATCETKRTSEYIVSATCQACLDAKCCSQQKTCFDIAAPDESKVNCNDYAACIDDCSGTATTEEELDACYGDCDLTAADGVQTAYEAIVSCGVADCAAECGAE